jgi:hypothetical protein
MQEARWLKSRILLAFATPTLLAHAGCSTPEHSAKMANAVEASEKAPSDTMCKTWLKGRQRTWCTTGIEAKALRAKDVSVSQGCPEKLDITKLSKALKGKKLGRLKRTETEVIRLHEKSQTASSDCGQNICCYVWAGKGRRSGGENIIRGRPLMVADSVTQASPSQSPTWLAGPPLKALGLNLSQDRRSTVANFWVQAALAEHASVASFARASLELMTVAAPAALLRDYHSAALDEINHATLCFRAAVAFGSKEMSPGALPSVPLRQPCLEEIAYNTFKEGCVIETMAAVEASIAAKKIDDPTLRRHAHRIADDEMRHSELAWRTLDWALENVPHSSIERISASLPAIREEALTGYETSEGLETYGILDGATRQHIAEHVWDTVIRPSWDTLVMKRG